MSSEAIIFCQEGREEAGEKLRSLLFESMKAPARFFALPDHTRMESLEWRREAEREAEGAVCVLFVSEDARDLKPEETLLRKVLPRRAFLVVNDGALRWVDRPDDLSRDQTHASNQVAARRDYLQRALQIKDAQDVVVCDIESEYRTSELQAAFSRVRARSLSEEPARRPPRTADLKSGPSSDFGREILGHASPTIDNLTEQLERVLESATDHLGDELKVVVGRLKEVGRDSNDVLNSVHRIVVTLDELAPKVNEALDKIGVLTAKSNPTSQDNPSTIEHARDLVESLNKLQPEIKQALDIWKASHQQKNEAGAWPAIQSAILFFGVAAIFAYHRLGSDRVAYSLVQYVWTMIYVPLFPYLVKPAYAVLKSDILRRNAGSALTKYGREKAVYFLISSLMTAAVWLAPVVT